MDTEFRAVLRKTARLLSIILFCVVVFCSIAFILLSYALENIFTYTDNTTLSEFTQATNISFPRRTRLEHCVNSSFQDSFYDAKVIIHKADLAGFLKSISTTKSGKPSIKIKTSKTDRLGITNSACTYQWWDPDSIQNFKAIRIERSGITVDEWERMELIIDLGSPAYAAIYIHYVGD